MYKYELRTSNEGNDSLFCDSILTSEQIDKIVTGKRREKYSINDEFKMNRLLKTSTEWKEYDTYMKACSEAGHVLKTQAKTDIENWQDYQRSAGEDEKAYIERLKKAGLI